MPPCGVSCIDGPDRQAHGGLPFVEWYVKQVCDYATAHGGLRLVDALDVHFYPRGNVCGLGRQFELGTARGLAAQRLRSLRELYDPPIPRSPGSMTRCG
ncbi:MAG: hypothetical protein IPG63_17645 [Xanthomonadales bacterium]|nr:hypothetical protein [Xanthomonadales bacterium]